MIRMIVKIDPTHSIAGLSTAPAMAKVAVSRPVLGKTKEYQVMEKSRLPREALLKCAATETRKSQQASLVSKISTFSKEAGYRII